MKIRKLKAVWKSFTGRGRIALALCAVFGALAFFYGGQTPDPVLEDLTGEWQYRKGFDPPKVA